MRRGDIVNLRLNFLFSAKRRWIKGKRCWLSINYELFYSVFEFWKVRYPSYKIPLLGTDFIGDSTIRFISSKSS